MAIDVKQLITDEANRQGVPAKLALAVASKESGFMQWLPNGSVKRGRDGEIGIFQLMPATAKELGVDAYDIYENIRGGVTYLRQQLRKFGTWDKAIIGYNCGPGCAEDVIAGRREIPHVTLAYLAFVGNVAGYGPAPIAQRDSKVAATSPAMPGQPRPTVVSYVTNPVVGGPAKGNVTLIAAAAMVGIGAFVWYMSDSYD